MISKKDFIKINDYLWEIPKGFWSDMLVPARIYASAETLEQILKDQSVHQLINGAALPGIINYTLAMPDCHEGYNVPIGFVGAIKASDGVISPGACGFDINCGVRLLKSNYQENEIKPFLEKLINEIQRQVPSGLGQARQIKLTINQIDKILKQGAQRLVDQGYGEKQDIENCESNGKLDWADPEAVSNQAKRRGQNQVGTLGSGNHFIEIQTVAEIFNKQVAEQFNLFQNQIVIMIHCGSRGLGHQVCDDYLKEFIPLMSSKYKIKLIDKGFAFLPFNCSEGQQYFKAMASAANYAWANRQMISFFIRQAWQNVLKEKNSSLSLVYDVAHNIIKKEKHVVNNKKIETIVHRKGATRAFPANHPEIPEKYQNVGQPVLLPGTMGTFSYVMNGQQTAEQAFFSTSHGAGRVMSRKAALKSFSGQNVINELKSKGIIVKCQSNRGIIEEAPFAYKDVNQVAEIVDQAGLSKKVAKLKPLAVIKGE